MEIIKENMMDNMNEIMKDIESAHFISWDCEFSGLRTENIVRPFDTPEEVFYKEVKTTDGFIMIQLGLSFFRFEKIAANSDATKTDDKNNKVFCKTYNIYVYPQSKNATFMCQGQSLAFLAKNDFDFNKLFKNGINYCNEAEEEKLLKEFDDRQTVREEFIQQRKTDEPVDNSNKIYLEIPDNENEMINKATEDINKLLNNTLKEVVFDKLNGFQRKLIYELIECHFSTTVSTSTRNIENNRKALVVELKRTEEQEMVIDSDKKAKDLKQMNESIGLRLLMKEISRSKKLIIGHNSLLDMMYIIKQCFAPLPPTYNEFKLQVHKLFPNFIDTKFIGTTSQYKEMFNSTVLIQVYHRLCEEPFEKTVVEWEDRYHSYSLDEPKEHEAGFDAFLTGYCFLTFAKHLKVDFIDQFEAHKCNALKPFLNRIALQRSLVPYIFITVKEPTISRDHIFHIKFMKTWQTSDIQYMFKNYGPVTISWIDDCSAFIALYNKENASCVTKTISHPPGFEIMTFAQHLMLDTKKPMKRPSEAIVDTKQRTLSESSDSGSHKNNPKKAKSQFKKVKKTFEEKDTW